VNEAHIMSCPSVTLLYLGHEWRAVDAVRITCLYPEEIVLPLIVRLAQVPGMR
jgi:hypothetical protein